MSKDSGIVMLPTAYRADDKTGFNIDGIVTFYIGHLYQRMKDFRDELVPIRILLMGGDVKFGIKEGNFMPALAVGSSGLLRFPLGQTQHRHYAARITPQTKFTNYLYFTLSKVFLNRISLNFGLLNGDINFLFEPLWPYETHKFSNLAYISCATLHLGKTKLAIEALKPSSPKNLILLHSILLKFLGFDIGYVKASNGYSILGYFNFRFTMHPRQK